MSLLQDKTAAACLARSRCARDDLDGDIDDSPLANAHDLQSVLQFIRNRNFFLVCNNAIHFVIRFHQYNSKNSCKEQVVKPVLPYFNNFFLFRQKTKFTFSVEMLKKQTQTN